MNIFQAIVLATIQGLTEFLPISSSAHLEFFPWLFNWQNHSLAYDAALHLGTAIAVGGYFIKEIIKLVQTRSVLLKYIIIGSLPASIIGFFGEKIIDERFHATSSSLPLLACGLIFFGILMWYVDKKYANNRQLTEINTTDALKLGFAQAVALIPGVSRSGITITAARYLKLNRSEATFFSFLLGMPLTLGAGLYKTIGLILQPQTITEPLATVVVGITVSAIVGFIAIKWLLDYVKNHSLAVFMWYRIILGGFILLTYYLR